MDLNKQQLRAILKEKRAALPPDEKKERDRAIVERIASSAAFQRASSLLLYAPHKGEIDLIPLVRIARKMGKAVAFPRCNPADCTMAFYELTPDTRLAPGAYGIPEPPAHAPLHTPDEHSLCILPGLTFDQMGNRLGYGKGYYDRYLTTFPGVTAGAVYAALVVVGVPTEPHDLPADLLFTEKESRPCTEKGRAALQRGQGRHGDLAAHASELVKRVLPKKEQSAPKKAKQRITPLPKDPRAAARILFESALHVPPVLVLSVFLLLLLSRPVEPYLGRTGEFVGVILLQLLIFLLPAILYGKLRGEGFSRRVRLRLPRIEHLWLILCILMLMLTGGLLTSILTGGISSLGGNFTLYSLFTAHYNGTPLEILYVILAYALLPALGEELIFRSILCAEYEKKSVPVAVTVSALFFAMLHFSFPHFLTYLFLGLLLALSMYATRSALTPILLHFCYNLFCLFGQPYLSAFYVNAGSNRIFVFCLVTLFLLFAAFAAGEARKIYHHYAKRNTDSSYAVSVEPRLLPRTLLGSLFTPAAGACVLLWLILSTVYLF